MSIRFKLAILLLAISSIPLFLISVLTFKEYENSLESLRVSQLKNTAAFKAEKIEDYFSTLKTDAQIIQNKYVVRKNLPILIRFAAEPANQEFVFAKSMLDGTLSKDMSILGLSDIILFNPEGKIVYSSNPGHYENYFLNTFAGPGQKAFLTGKDKIYFSDILFDKNDHNKSVILVTAPAFDINAGFIGVIALEADMAPMYRLIQDTTGLGNTGEIILGRKVGDQIIYLNPLRHKSQSGFNRKINIGEKIGIPIQRAAQGKSGSGQAIDYRGRGVIAAWRNIPSLNWGIVAKIDTEEAFAEVINLRRLIIVVFLVVVIFCGMIAFSIASSISEPIRKLSKGVQVVGSGNLDYKVAIDNKDEIGQLSAAFDKMTLDLKVSTAATIAERNRLYGVLEALPVYVILLSEDYHVSFANKFFRERFGESGGRRCYEYLFKLNAPCDNCETYKVMKTNVPHHWEWLGPDGRNYDIYDFPFIDADGSRMILEMGIDITARKQAELALNQLNETLEQRVAERTAALAESAADLYEIQLDLNRAQLVASTGSWRLNLLRNELVWSDEAYRIFAISRETPLTYETFLTFVHPEERDYVDQKWNEALKGGPFDVEHRILANGQVKWVRQKAEFEFDHQGKATGGFGTVSDITERKAAEEALGKERENLRKIFDVVNIGLLLIDEEGVVSKVNNTVSLWLGKDISLSQNRQPGNIMGCVHALNDPAGCGHTPYCSNCLIRNTFERVLRTGEPAHNVEIQANLLLSGKNMNLWFEVNVEPIILDGRRHAILSMNNITTRKQAEEVLMRDKETFEKLVSEKTRELINVQLELEQAKRLSDIGTLAATVAHELRNPLAAIKMASYNAQRKAQNPMLDKHFSNIEIKLHESENIIDNLLFYSKIRVPHCAPINIHNIFSACIRDVKARFPEYKVSIARKDSSIKDLLVEADAVQVREIFANLLNNSFDAVGEENGQIEIKAEVDDQNVKIAVKDNGAGIDKDNLERIFQPFFSTKAKGTGLGLTVAQQVAKLHGGSINLESQKGKGTTVTVILPIKHNPNA